MLRNVDVLGSYRAAALATVDLVRARGWVEDLASTVLVAGFMQLARQHDHRERKGLQGYREPMVMDRGQGAPVAMDRAPTASVVTDQAAAEGPLVAHNAGTRTALWDTKFYIPGHGRVLLSQMTRPMVAYKWEMYSGMERDNRSWRLVFERLLARLPADASTRVADVCRPEEVEDWRDQD
jgi:hypothetical protein